MHGFSATAVSSYYSYGDEAGTGRSLRPDAQGGKDFLGLSLVKCNKQFCHFPRHLGDMSMRIEMRCEQLERKANYNFGQLFVIGGLHQRC